VLYPVGILGLETGPAFGVQFQRKAGWENLQRSRDERHSSSQTKRSRQKAVEVAFLGIEAQPSLRSPAPEVLDHLARYPDAQDYDVSLSFASRWKGEREQLIE
jgi:hypothetical protein